MSPLAHAQRFAQRQQRLSDAQMAHLRQTAYRGVNTTAHQSPAALRAQPKVCTYRGVSYKAS
ncbi:hypothetical protein [Synechococcus sp. SYN20]|uniref:hypothetical protein n=1 Tax=Synechococcus sp. SYN20 TaxID=1050714 RepID=UPI001644FC12|nr:hypothetical protein [Synechococcus sp. SYN20]